MEKNDAILLWCSLGDITFNRIFEMKLARIGNPGKEKPIIIDKDNNFIVVSDRTNNRVVWLTFDFKYVRSKTLTEGLALPCNVCTIYHLILQFLYHLYETYVAIAATTRTTLSIYLYIYTYVHKQDKNLTCNTHVHMHYF